MIREIDSMFLFFTDLRAEIQQVKNELKELYNDAQLKKVRTK